MGSALLESECILCRCLLKIVAVMEFLSLFVEHAQTIYPPFFRQDKAIASNDSGVEDNSVLFHKFVCAEVSENFAMLSVVLEPRYPIKEYCAAQTVQTMIQG